MNIRNIPKVSSECSRCSEVWGGLAPPAISAYDYVIETAAVVAVTFREQAQLKPLC